PQRGGGGPGGRGDQPGAVGFKVPLEPYLDAAGRQLPTWQTISLSLPTKGSKSLQVTVSEKFPWHPYARSSMKLDPASAKVTEWKPFMEQSLGARIRGTMRPLQTGEAGGWAGQTIAAAGAAGGALLVWTGMALALRRFCRFRRKKQ